MSLQEVVIPLRKLTMAEIGTALAMVETHPRVDVAWRLGCDLASLDAALASVGWVP